MRANEITAGLLVIVFALGGVYDAFVGLTHGYDSTITAVVRDYASRWSIIPFAAGALVAHLFGW